MTDVMDGWWHLACPSRSILIKSYFNVDGFAGNSTPSQRIPHAVRLLNSSPNPHPPEQGLQGNRSHDGPIPALSTKMGGTPVHLAEQRGDACAQ